MKETGSNNNRVYGFLHRFGSMAHHKRRADEGRKTSLICELYTPASEELAHYGQLHRN